MDDLLLYGAIGITVLFFTLILLAACVIWGIAWIAATLLAGRFDLVAMAAFVVGVVLAAYWLTGLVLARLGIL